MRFGVFYEHQLPRVDGQLDERQLLCDALDQVELADRLGIDYLWEVEHHFLEEYSHSSAPEVFLAAASQRTGRIRLGHGIVQAPPAVNHPARIAERVATLDLISGGRVEFGTGEGGSQIELGGFGVEREVKRAQWEESLDAITRMFVEEPFAGYDGRWISMPPRNVVPKPMQRPHPPLWMACSRRETILTAAENGIGALSFSFVEPEDAKEWVDSYYETITSERCTPAGFSVNPNVAVVLPMMCHGDEQTAIDRGIDGAHFFGFSLAYYYGFGEHRPGHSNIWREFNERRAEVGFAREIVTPDAGPLGVRLLQHGLGSLRGAIGTPDQIADLIARYEAAGVDQVIFVSQAGPNRHEHICESLELFAAEVAPRFSGMASEREREKAERLAGALDAALVAAFPRTGRRPRLRRQAGHGAGARRRDRRGDEQRTISRAARPTRAGRAGRRVRVRGAGSKPLRRPASPHVRPRARRRRSSSRGWSVPSWPTRRRDSRARSSTSSRAAMAPEAGPCGSRMDERVPGVGRRTLQRSRCRTSVPDFVRVAAREAFPPKLLLEGSLVIEGDFAVAGRLGEMFGAGPPT